MIGLNDVVSPAVKHRSIRILLAKVVRFDLELEQMDVNTSFPYGDLYATILMKKP